MTGEYVCLTYNRSETYTVYHSKLACQVNLRSMMLFVCPDLSPSCLFHCHHRGVDKFVGLWGWDVEYCCTLYFYGRLSKYLHNYMHLRTPSPLSTPLHHPWGVSSPVLNQGLNGQPHHSCLNLPATSPLQTNTFGVHQHGQAFNYRRHSIITVMVNMKQVKTIACVTGNTQFVIV